MLALLAGCSPRTELGGSAPAAGNAEELRGVVQIVGSAPVNTQVILQPREGSGIRLAGELRDELARLAGAEVVVRGVVQPSGDPIVSRAMDVIGYEVIAINGRPVLMGEVVSVGGGDARIRMADGTEVNLLGAPSSFAVGQKVWVQGVHSVSVQAYGTVRP